jgi:UDP-N-acetyl-2-amino-2-deoxyglucuronate dehydrogenase
MNVNIALIGCGRIGSRHAEQIAKVALLVAVCDTNKDRAIDMAKKYGCNYYFSVEEMLLHEKDIDLASICTPNGLHASHSIACLNNKINVLCEKPLAIRAIDGLAMINASIANNCKLFVVKQNRFNPPVAAVKQLLKNNSLGKIHSFQINCFWNRPNEYYAESDWKGSKKLDGGTLFTQFSHFIDLLYWFLGDVAAVKATIANYQHPNIEIEDTGVVLFEMENCVIGTLNYTVNSFGQNMEGSFSIFGENGTVKIGGQYLNELEYQQIKGVDTIKLDKGNTANNYGYYQGSMSNHDKVYQNLMSALANNDNELASAEDGLKTVEIIEKIYNSAKA